MVYRGRAARGGCAGVCLEQWSRCQASPAGTRTVTAEVMWDGRFVLRAYGVPATGNVLGNAKQVGRSAHRERELLCWAGCLELCQGDGGANTRD